MQGKSPFGSSAAGWTLQEARSREEVCLTLAKLDRLDSSWLVPNILPKLCTSINHFLAFSYNWWTFRPCQKRNTKKGQEQPSRAPVLLPTYLDGAVFGFGAAVSVPSASLYNADYSQRTILFQLSREVIDDAIGESSNLISSFLQTSLSCVCGKFGSKLAFSALKAPFPVLQLSM